MTKAEKLEYSELPDSVGLYDAIDLNQRLWRSRDRLLSASSPMEVPGKMIQKTLDKVRDRYAEYILPYYKTHNPIVGFSVLPEMLFSWDKGYYLPDFGKVRPLKIFMEFGTEWLANEAIGKDPLTNNHYLPELVDTLDATDKNSKVYQFLWGILGLIALKNEPRETITDLFARSLIEGDAAMLEKLGVEFSDGQIATYSDAILELRTDEDFSEKARSLTFDNSIQKAIVKPVFFAVSTLQQIRDSRRSVRGVTSVPGIVNLAGFKQPEGVLAHEFIHSLGYGEKTWGGIPINGYKIGLGANIKNDGKS